MNDSFLFTLFEGLNRQGPGSDACTTRMFNILAPPEHARILDIGCGSGSQTLTLARRCMKCRITAVDIHPPFLEALRTKADKEGMGERITPLCASMDDLPFAPESFDVIWAEGSVFVIGFAKGLSYWKKFLKSGGSLALSEMVWFSQHPPEEVARFMQEAYPAMTTIPECGKMIQEAGYELVGSFRLPPEAWWKEFYDPLEKKIEWMEREPAENQDAGLILDMTRKEIDLFRTYSDYYGYQVFLLRKCQE
jgi:ubiquinone/menaquinone biosynthesis C-methylase UbiE